MKYATRSVEKEWLDLGPSYYTPEEYSDCLYQLDRIGRYLGGDSATLKALRRLPTSPTSILDVGCGGGLFTLKLARLYPEAHVKGIDISRQAIAFAERQRQAAALSHVTFVVPDSPQLEEVQNSFDLVTATLVCHHLDDAELVLFLQKAYAIASHAVIINDLHRHRLASVFFALAAALFFPNRLIKHDGQLSIRRAFTRRDWETYLQMAQIPRERYSIRWHWAFRWIVVIDATHKS